MNKTQLSQSNTFAIFSKKKQSWESCQTISEGLQGIYQKVPCTKLYIDECFTEEDFAPILRVRKKYKNTKLIIVDNEPHQFKILDFLINHLHLYELEYYIHIYGDFTYFSREWLNLFKKQNKKIKIKFLVASNAQRRLLSFLLDPFADSIDVVPFPNKMIVSESKKQKINHRYFLYTGRIHQQKNVDVAIRVFLDHIISKNIRDVSFLIIGDVDEHSGMNCSLNEGTLILKIQLLLQRYPEWAREKIIIKSSLERNKLYSYYNQCLGFINLSTFHDEDYGMSVHEALSLGVPCYLSNWGGLSDFDVKGCDVKFAPVSFSQFSYSFDTSDFDSFFKDAIKRSFKQRQEKASVFLRKFGYKNITNLLLETLTPPRPKKIQTKNLAKFVHFKRWNPAKKVYNFFPVFDSFYNQTYSHYIDSAKTTKHKNINSTYRTSWVEDFLKQEFSSQLHSFYFSDFLNSTFQNSHKRTLFGFSSQNCSLLKKHMKTNDFTFLLNGFELLNSTTPARLKIERDYLFLHASNVGKIDKKYAQNEIFFYEISSNRSEKEKNLLISIVLDGTPLKVILNELSKFDISGYEKIKVYTSNLITHLNDMNSILKNLNNFFYHRNICFEFIIEEFPSISTLKNYEIIEINSQRLISYSHLYLNCTINGIRPVVTSKIKNLTLITQADFGFKNIINIYRAKKPLFIDTKIKKSKKSKKVH